MTTVNPQEVSLILILGEMKGDLKNMTNSLTAIDAKISTVDSAAESRHDNHERRLAGLEAIKTRIGALAIAAGILAGAIQPKLAALAQFLIGG